MSETESESGDSSDDVSAAPELWRCCNLQGHMWQTIALQRARTHRDEARYQCSYGFTALHRLVHNRNPPLDVMMAVHGAYPEAATMQDKEGETPLHHAVRCSRPKYDVAKFLITSSPEALRMESSNGQSPLHVACASTYSRKVLSTLVAGFPEAAKMKDKRGRTPLDLLTKRYYSFFRFAFCGSDEEDAMTLLRSWGVHSIAMWYWKVSCLLVKAASHRVCDGAIQNGQTWQVLHTCVGMDRCPSETILLAARLYPGQMRQSDGKGNLPLHLAAANRNLNGKRADVQVRTKKRKLRRDDEGGFSWLTREDAVDLIARLVQLNPDAAVARNGDGRLPLNLALESGKGWDSGVEAIIGAAGDHVVTERDARTGLYPFMLAAVGEEPCITTVYQLFRRCPELKRFSR